MLKQLTQLQAQSVAMNDRLETVAAENAQLRKNAGRSSELEVCCLKAELADKSSELTRSREAASQSEATLAALYGERNRLEVRCAELEEDARASADKWMWELVNEKRGAALKAREVETKMVRADNSVLRQEVRRLSREVATLSSMLSSRRPEADVVVIERERDELRARVKALVETSLSQATARSTERWKGDHLLRQQEGQLEASQEQAQALQRQVSDQAQELEEASAKLDKHKEFTKRRLKAMGTTQTKINAANSEAAARTAAATLVQSHLRARRARAERESMQAKKDLKNVRDLSTLSMRAAEQGEDIERKLRGLAANDSGTAAVQPMTLVGTDGRERSLEKGLLHCLMGGYVSSATEEPAAAAAPRMRCAKFFGSNGVNELLLGQPEAAALGIISYLKVDLFELFARLGKGTRAIEEEVTAAGTDEDRECLDYVLRQPAGSSALEFSNGVRDLGRNGERLADFCNHPSAQKAQLTEAHVVALRLYTTACYKSLNGPLRQAAAAKGQPLKAHPFAATVFFLADGIRKLRAVSATDQPDVMDLWRGMRDLQSTSDFERSGGSEVAPMSATSDPAVAVSYGASKHSLLFKIRTDSFMNRGADIGFLSAFPNERECVRTLHTQPYTLLERVAMRGTPCWSLLPCEIANH